MLYTNRNRGAAILCGIATAALLLALLVLCVWGVAFDRGFYREEYHKLQTADYVGTDEDTLFLATDTLLDYLEDERGDLDVPLGEGQFFNERETAHMTDVKALYQNAVVCAWVLAVFGGAALAVCFAAGKKRVLPSFLCGSFWGGIAMLVFFACVGVYAAADFNTFWTNFHLMFFSNDLWMLNPATDRMIRMFEQQFFFDMVARILVVYLCIFAGLLIANRVVVRRRRV